MGQAKRKGTYEERRAASIEEQAFIVKTLREQEAAWFATLTDEEQATVKKNRQAQAQKNPSMARWINIPTIKR